MKTTNTIYVLLAIVLGAGVLFFYTQPAAAPAPAEVENLPASSTVPAEEAVLCTQDVMECPDGSYVSRVAPECSFAACPDRNPAKTNPLIQVVAPEPGQIISSPLQLTGEAAGPWYFEASAPVELRDWQGNVIAQSYITAQGDWMVSSMVSFIGEITFSSTYAVNDPVEQQQGSLVFKKANPSGQPELADEIVVPILFASP